MKSLHIVSSIGLVPPELYIAVNHSSYPNICDSCELQGLCYSQFGDRGANCPIYKHGYRWQKVTTEQIEAIIKLKNGEINEY